MSGEELTSLETVLQKYIPPQELAEVQRILYGKPAGVLELGETARSQAEDQDYELAGWSIEAAPEETRPPREVSNATCQCSLLFMFLSLGEDWSDTEQDCLTN